MLRATNTARRIRRPRGRVTAMLAPFTPALLQHVEGAPGHALRLAWGSACGAVAAGGAGRRQGGMAACRCGGARKRDVYSRVAIFERPCRGFSRSFSKLPSTGRLQGLRAAAQPYDMKSAPHQQPRPSARDRPERGSPYVQPSRRPKDRLYGENPNGCSTTTKPVVLKPAPANILELYLGSLQSARFRPLRRHVRFSKTTGGGEPDLGCGPGWKSGRTAWR